MDMNCGHDMTQIHCIPDGFTVEQMIYYMETLGVMPVPVDPIVETKIHINCVNCGAPVSNTNKCVYCGTYFR